VNGSFAVMAKVFKGTLDFPTYSNIEMRVDFIPLKEQSRQA
jgi:hypothetical protein